MKEAELIHIVSQLVDELGWEVFQPLHEALKKQPTLRSTLNPAFPFPQVVRVGWLGGCLAIEYVGPERPNEPQIAVAGVWYPEYSIFDFLGVDISHLNPLVIPWEDSLENISFFLGDSITLLTDYFYDFSQRPQHSVLNGVYDFSDAKKPVYFSNCTFFWTDTSGSLKVKHVDFLEIFPIQEDGWYYHDEASLQHFREFLLQHRVPGYEVELHRTLNEFIELVNDDGVHETTITRFLEANHSVLQLAFGIHALNPQITLEWQYSKEAPALRPDFLPTRMDGYADIMEFKLPRLKSTAIVGTASRRQPSFEIDSAIAQLEQYDEWSSQEVNRRWLEETKGIKMLYPQKYLIIGHSDNFSAEERQRLRRTRGTSVFTYDEFIELARYQLYRSR